MRNLGLTIILAICCLVAGCGALVKKTTGPMVDNLTLSILKQRDVEMVRQGAPAYLLFFDGLLEGSPDDAELLLTAAKLYTAYATAFADDEQRALLLTDKAKTYAVRALALRNDDFAELWDKPAELFFDVPQSMGQKDKDFMLAAINAWAAYIVARPGSWDDVADVPKVQALVERLLELDEGYSYGSAHLFMGVLTSLLPAELGGQPEVAKAHFERAIALSHGRYLPAKVAYAARYAKLLYDRELHDRLLHEVMESPVDAIPELTLINTLAQMEAARLLAEADDYF